MQMLASQGVRNLRGGLPPGPRGHPGIPVRQLLPDCLAKALKVDVNAVEVGQVGTNPRHQGDSVLVELQGGLPGREDAVTNGISSRRGL